MTACILYIVYPSHLPKVKQSRIITITRQIRILTNVICITISSNVFTLMIQTPLFCIDLLILRMMTPFGWVISHKNWQRSITTYKSSFCFLCSSSGYNMGFIIQNKCLHRYSIRVTAGASKAVDHCGHFGPKLWTILDTLGQWTMQPPPATGLYRDVQQPLNLCCFSLT